MDKQQKKPTISTQNLFQLIQKKLYTQYKNYIAEVQLQNSHAEQAVVTNLNEILVSKKYKDPSICFNALVFYKMLMVSASMDFLCEDTLFPQAIHRQLYNICIYKGKEKNLQTRCSHYFSELFQIPYNQQNGRFSYNYILLSLQLLKSLAKWYPSNYNSPKQPSIFKQMYDRLIADNIYFPVESKFALVKEADQQKFKNNYAKFKSYFQQAQNQLDQLQTPQPKLSTPVKPKKIQIQKPPKQKPGNYDNEPNLPELKTQLMSKQKSSINKTELNMIELRGSLMTKQRNTLNVENQTPREIEQLNGQPNPKTNKMKEDRSSLEQVQIKIKQTIKPSSISMKSNQTNNKRSVLDKQQVIIMKKQLNTPKYNQKQYQKKSFLQNQINRMTQKIVEKHDIIKQLGTNKLDVSFNANASTQRNATPKKMFRTEKKNMGSPVSRQKNNNLSAQNKSSSHKSLPKTQKRKISIKEEKLKTFKTWVDFQGPQNQKLKNTLSQLSSLRKEVLSKQTDQYRQVAAYLKEMRFDTKRITFNIDNFKPLRLSLVSLRNQALNVADYPNPFNQFYTGLSVEARLIKEGLGIFTLSLRNISEDALSIGFKDMSNEKFSNNIKILSWDNKTDFKPYSTSSLLRNNHLDIKFTVTICDYKLKFLPFDILINGDDCFFALPITLLDMAHPKNTIQALNVQEFRIKGTTIVTNPFQLRSSGLPKFMGSFCFRQFNITKISQWHERIIGGCRLQIPLQSYVKEQKKQVIALIKVVSYPKRQIQIVIVFDKRDIQSERFSLAFLQLLQFLLTHE